MLRVFLKKLYLFDTGSRVYFCQLGLVVEICMVRLQLNYFLFILVNPNKEVKVAAKSCKACNSWEKKYLKVCSCLLLQAAFQKRAKSHIANILWKFCIICKMIINYFEFLLHFSEGGTMVEFSQVESSFGFRTIGHPHFMLPCLPIVIIVIVGIDRRSFPTSDPVVKFLQSIRDAFWMFLDYRDICVFVWEGK